MVSWLTLRDKVRGMSGFIKAIFYGVATLVVLIFLAFFGLFVLSEVGSKQADDSSELIFVEKTPSPTASSQTPIPTKSSPVSSSPQQTEVVKEESASTLSTSAQASERPLSTPAPNGHAYDTVKSVWNEKPLGSQYSLDARGWVGTDAYCANEEDNWIYAAFADNANVVICKSERGEEDYYYYRGVINNQSTEKPIAMNYFEEGRHDKFRIPLEYSGDTIVKSYSLEKDSLELVMRATTKDTIKFEGFQTR